jgi:hypothetical protein
MPTQKKVEKKYHNAKYEHTSAQERTRQVRRSVCDAEKSYIQAVANKKRVESLLKHANILVETCGKTKLKENEDLIRKEKEEKVKLAEFLEAKSKFIMK